MWYHWWCQWVTHLMQPLVAIDTKINEVRQDPHRLWHHLFGNEDSLGSYVELPNQV